jgi:6-phosphogluconolactonase/glucosamine-6-phosphate isomerase/deaminase
MIEVHTSSDPEIDAANAITHILETYTKENVLLLFSGGSALALVDHIHPRVLSSRHTLSVLDERYMFEEEDSNFFKLMHTNFFKQSQVNKSNYIDPRPKQGESLEETSRRFDLALKHWHILHRDGIVIATVGIGPDGHTSGILPMPEKETEFKKVFLDEKLCAVGYETTPEKSPHTKRITTTITYLLRHITHAVIYATGKQKKEILQKTLYSNESYAVLPSCALNKVSDAHLYTDISL